MNTFHGSISALYIGIIAATLYLAGEGFNPHQIAYVARVLNLQSYPKAQLLRDLYYIADRAGVSYGTAFMLARSMSYRPIQETTLKDIRQELASL